MDDNMMDGAGGDGVTRLDGADGGEAPVSGTEFDALVA